MRWWLVTIGAVLTLMLCIWCDTVSCIHSKMMKHRILKVLLKLLNTVYWRRTTFDVHLLCLLCSWFLFGLESRLVLMCMHDWWMSMTYGYKLVISVTYDLGLKRQNKIPPLTEDWKGKECNAKHIGFQSTYSFTHSQDETSVLKGSCRNPFFLFMFSMHSSIVKNVNKWIPTRAL